MKNLIFAIAFLLFTIPCLAEIIIVDQEWPYDFNNIWSAINYSHSGDYIIVFPGTYTGPDNVNLNFHGKAITLQSVDPTNPYIVAQTIIDCNGYDVPAFHFFDENDNSVVAGFTIKNGNSPQGGGIYCDSLSSPTIAYCTITGNEAIEGGGIYCYLSDPMIYYCTITASSAEHRGGGIYCEYLSPIIYGCTISGNNGAGIYCRNSAPIIYGCTITGNTNSGIFCDSDSSATITNCTITNNSARDGGGIYCEGDYDSIITGSPEITNCNITANSVINRGGGIFCDSHSSPNITNCTITNNLANDGGGIFCAEYFNQMFINGSPAITNCTVNGNEAEFGGGIYCSYKSSPAITNCTISGNTGKYGPYGYGGGIYCEGDTNSTITNCTITGNSTGNGGGIFLSDVLSPRLVQSSIIWGNSDTSGTGQSAQVYFTGGGSPKVWFSCIQDDNPDDADVPFGEYRGNIDDDPCFVALGSGYWDDNDTPEDISDDFWVWSNGDYHLLPASPCFEVGDPYYTYHPEDVDMDGQPRLMGRYVDMGADEFEIAMIVVTKPQGGEVWAAGSAHEINWDSFNITGAVDISYSDNNGVDWVKIDNSPDTGSFLWHLPAAVDSNQCLVSVEPNVPVSNLICTKSGPFTIHPDSPGPPLESKWKSLGGDFDRAGLSQDSGPELGCVKWQFQTGGPVSASPSIGPYGRIHLSCEDGKLYTLDANGQLLWCYDTNSPLLSSPSIGPDGSVYVGAQNGKLYAIDVNGNLRWTHSTDGFIYSSPAISADGNIFLCSQDGSLYALGRDGSELWTFETGGVSPVATGAIFASPAIGPNSTIYIAGVYNPYLYAIDSNTGSVKWICDFSNPTTPGKAPWPFASPVVAPDGNIYQTLLYDPNLYAIPGRLIAEGEFITTGGTSAKCIAAWGSNLWKPLGSGMDNSVYALTVYNGKLIAGGSFWTAGGVYAEGIAAWTGRYWQSLVPWGGPVYALTVYNNKLIAGGNLPDHIAQLNGNSWQSLGNGVNGLVRALTAYNGELIAGGDFTTAGGISANYIAAWNGSSWQPLGNGMNRPVRALTVYDGLLIAGGEFTTADGEPVNYIAAWDGDSWWPLGLGMDHYVYALTVYNDELIAGGEFSKADGLSANNIAAYDGSSWHALGSGVNNNVYALMVYNGELIAGGSFRTAGGADANSIAAWNGSSWRSIGNRMNLPVLALTVYDGDLIAGGEFEFTTSDNYEDVILSTNLACLVLQYGRESDEYVIWCGDYPLEYREIDGGRCYYIEINGDQYDVYCEYDDGERDYAPGVGLYPYAYCWSEPVLGPDGTIYVSFDDSYLRAVEPNGSTKWVTRLGMVGGFTLTVGSNGLIYAASDDAYLCVLDPDGKEIARFKGDNWLSFPVITADNTMIVSDANNTVWALGGNGCEGQTAALHRPQDLSADRTVNFNDFALIANDWLKQYPDDEFYFTGDIDRDLYVDFSDLAQLADKWLSQE